jgi:hypothetical protein
MYKTEALPLYRRKDLTTSLSNETVLPTYGFGIEKLAEGGKPDWFSWFDRNSAKPVQNLKR